MKNVRKGGCDEIGGKKFLPLPPSGAEVFDSSLLTLLPPY